MKRKNGGEELHQAWYETQVLHQNTNFLGIKAERNPLDAWVFQEIITKHQPDVIIEVGSHKGGTSLYLATICDALKRGIVISIEIQAINQANHPRIKHICGDSISQKIFDMVKSFIGQNDSVMVILDSDHHKEHVAKELALYGNIVTSNQYLIVDDNYWGPGGIGPYQAVVEFLAKRNDYTTDTSWEKYFLTFIPNGFLLRK